MVAVDYAMSPFSAQMSSHLNKNVMPKMASEIQLGEGEETQMLNSSLLSVESRNTKNYHSKS